MAAPAKQSRWGSLLQQAVAGVEARLDTMLAEGDEGGGAAKQQGPPDTPQHLESAVQTRTVQPPSTSASRSATASPGVRANDRLQTRLARAVAVRPISSAAASETGSIDAELSAATPRSPASSTRDSLDVPAEALQSREYSAGASAITAKQDARPARVATPPTRDSESISRENSSPSGITDVKVLVKGARDSDHQLLASPSTPKDILPASASSELTRLQAEHSEEVRDYVERIDALQAKLQYLAKEVASAARNSAASAAPQSPERRLAEKREKIALLLEEGQKLANTEQKHRAAIRKLVVQGQENEKRIRELTASRDAAKLELESMRGMGDRVDDLENRLEKSTESARLLKDEARALARQLDAKKASIQSLEGEIRRLHEQPTLASGAAGAHDQGRNGADWRVRNELEDKVETLEIEKKLAAERAQSRTAELQKEVDSARERANAAEREKEWELKAMEGKLEAMRIRTEDAASKAGGDSQVKLIRQVETLQSQYGIASKNWEGIEASLMARISSLEKERDEALRRESDMRKKARDSATRFRDDVQALQTQLLQKQQELDDRQREVDQCRSQLSVARKQLEQVESSLSQLRADHEKQVHSWKMDKGERADQERRHWLDDISGLASQSRPVSPLLPLTPQRTFSSDLFMFPGMAKARQLSTPASLHEGTNEGSVSLRRLSAQPPFPRSILADDDAVSTNHVLSPLEALTESPYAHSGGMEDRDGTSIGPKPSPSPNQALQDMVSMSTAGVGPSVQLVERMSTAIRRLEAEKVAAREELTRISNQRDEARAEIAALMKEMESQQATSARVSGLEKESADINSRYQTTLEMLGEKSELVEELRADVADLKQMYRELVERTIQ